MRFKDTGFSKHRHNETLPVVLHSSLDSIAVPLFTIVNRGTAMLSPPAWKYLASLEVGNYLEADPLSSFFLPTVGDLLVPGGNEGGVHLNNFEIKC